MRLRSESAWTLAACIGTLALWALLGCASTYDRVASGGQEPVLVMSRDGRWIGPGFLDRDSVYRAADSVWVWYGGKRLRWERARWGR